MDTKPLERFATWARRELISLVDAQASMVLADGSVPRTEHPDAVRRLEAEIKDHGRQHIIDKVAYTWFNRIIALRFMDVRGYTDAGVVSPVQGHEEGQPEILSDAKRGNLDPDVITSKRVEDAIFGLIDGTRYSTDAEGEAYAILLTEYCRYWHKFMPFMFEREGDYTELLIPANLLAEGAILSRTRKVLTEKVCEDVEVIGWLYQFYISERKQEIFDSKVKRGADEIPAATQLFTPHWIVKYLVENSIGRLWMLNHPESRLIDQMEYYISPVDEEPEFLKILGPEELTVIDPACGSGHMLTYAFDLLYAIYEEEGYPPLDIPELIFTHNLHGTEIDPRAGALAAFALTMKARAKQRTFFNRRIKPQICVIEPFSFRPNEINVLIADQSYNATTEDFFNQFEHADTLGSLILPDAQQTARFKITLDKTKVEGDILYADTLDRAHKLVHQAEILSECYAVVLANPPYMGSSYMDSSLSEFAKRYYPSSKNDMYAMFIERCLKFAGSAGSVGMVTQDSWMFLGAYARYRKWFLKKSALVTLAHLGTAAFDTIGGEVVSTVAFVTDGCRNNTRQTPFIRAAEVEGKHKAEIVREIATGAESEHYWIRCVSEFQDIPNTPIIYWASNDEIAALRTGPFLGDLIEAREGLTTADNDQFLRRWYEVSISNIDFGAKPTEHGSSSRLRWFPYQKGGPSRRWYGNFDFVVNWQEDGLRIRRNIDDKTGRVRSHNYNGKYAFRRGFTWSGISGDSFAVRHVEGGFMFDAKGPMAFANNEDDLFTLEGFLNSSTATRFMRLLAPRLDFKLGHVLSLPVRIRKNRQISDLVEQCVELARNAWDASELSRDFATSPLNPSSGYISVASQALAHSEAQRSRLLAKTEQEIDERFQNVYKGVESVASDDLPTAARDIAVSERRHIEDFVSYAVGCIFGRYSLDQPGLILADQEATLQDYLEKVPSPTFTPDADNVIPFVDDGWFEDDIVERFRDFLRITFGAEHFEENLRFIEESLNVKTLRDYFITKNGKSKFYDEHVKRYKKRPIYWMFSSPKGSFNALIYMHRYNTSTVSTVLNEYLREYRAKLEVALTDVETAAAGGSTKDQKEADRLRRVLVELAEYEHDVLYPLATRQLPINLDDGVLVNYLRFGRALKNIGLETNRKKVEGWDWPTYKLEPLS